MMKKENTERKQERVQKYRMVMKRKLPRNVKLTLGKSRQFGYGEGMEAVLKDPNIDAVVPIMMLTKETGVPPYDFIVELANKYPGKPLFVTFSADKKYMDECKDYVEPRRVPTFPEIEQPFEVLSILYRCTRAMQQPR